VPTIYLAGPLFSEAKQAWHRATKARIEAEMGYTVIWPFELFDQAEIVAWGDDAPRIVMEVCRAALVTCDFVVALLDGPQVDDGTAWEIGYAHAKGIPVIGIRTDFRQAGDVPGALVNAMIHGSCREIVKDVAQLVERVKVLTTHITDRANIR
jgi:nucleoside 2-deoxyribosyltransferase